MRGPWSAGRGPARAAQPARQRAHSPFGFTALGFVFVLVIHTAQIVSMRSWMGGRSSVSVSQGLASFRRWISTSAATASHALACRIAHLWVAQGLEWLWVAISTPPSPSRCTGFRFDCVQVVHTRERFVGQTEQRRGIELDGAPVGLVIPPPETSCSTTLLSARPSIPSGTQRTWLSAIRWPLPSTRHR